MESFIKAFLEVDSRASFEIKYKFWKIQLFNRNRGWKMSFDLLVVKEPKPYEYSNYPDFPGVGQLAFLTWRLLGTDYVQIQCLCGEITLKSFCRVNLSSSVVVK